MPDGSGIHLDQLGTSYRTVREPKMQRVLRIQAALGDAIREYLNDHGFTELLPPIIGPASDPGIRGATQAVIDFYGRPYTVMSSAILYKQMMAASLGRVYFFSPNVRLEPLETAATRRHLVEFVQVDIEEAGADYLAAMRRAEDLVSHVHDRMKDRHAGELAALGRSLNGAHVPFRRLRYDEALKILEERGRSVPYGVELPWDREEFLSSLFPEPFFVYDYPRESRGFYDREDPERPGILRDFDLLYPEGFGEAISGAERQFEYDLVVRRLRETGADPAKYGWYLDMLREGIPPSAGFGIGVERLTRYICGLQAVWEARPYPKVAGVFSP
ncbi:MAG TPA: asparagine synthetase A [Thermoplasmata archaeon]|nr:asparagine synthetase A [Thermoplasmata archaeon]